jgi:hypothetical protein
MNIAVDLQALGQQMVKCSACPEASTATVGTPPRCLWHQTNKSTDSGAIVVGLNPGFASPREVELYVKSGPTYDATVSYLQENSHDIDYFRKMRLFVLAAIGPSSIHWTEVSKCELAKNFKRVPIEMRRKFIHRYLKIEIDLLPIWPIFACGRIAFDTMSVLCTERTVIGVPHPTGSFGKVFSRLLTENNMLSDAAASRVKTAIADRSAL